MGIAPIRLTSFLVKIASRCNLACDYCYMYEHIDQTWRSQPTIMSDSVIGAMARRIGEYVRQEEIRRFRVLFHGGEPLLAGAGRLADAAEKIRLAVPPRTTISFSLQTNGTLLDQQALRVLIEAGIWVSLSIDGPRKANDLHRVDHQGRSSFERTLEALELLESNRGIYAGLISVVDPIVSADDLFEFFGPRKPPHWSFLLPDGHHERMPPGRDTDSTIYQRWLLHAFDVWFDSYPEIPVRLFDSILAACSGLPSETDTFGFGEPTLLTIETDGSYHGLDVLKITETAATALNLDLDRHSISEAANSPKMLSYRDLLRLDGLAPVCQDCPEVGVCGGGAVPHRYSHSGFKNPTVYCQEMLALIGHARTRMNQALSQVDG